MNDLLPCKTDAVFSDDCGRSAIAQLTNCYHARNIKLKERNHDRMFGRWPIKNEDIPVKSFYMAWGDVFHNLPEVGMGACFEENAGLKYVLSDFTDMRKKFDIKGAGVRQMA